ncbi:hypothetical protein [Qaidamihabitans albus]|uniref:hypothetical protein n=1 Tax=Qaidamihabitans albus TaxID=2795733 RepID=UPI0018F1E0C8|nr:hypothetical protein [Qaidamihabitans albus]
MADEAWMGEKRLDDVVAGGATEQVRQVFGGTSFWEKAVPGGSGSWTFDREQIEAVIGKWEALLEDVQEDRALLNGLMGTVVHPSEDDPSKKFVNLVWDGLGSLSESNTSMLVYIDNFLGKLRDARDRIAKAEARNEEPFQAATASTER